MYTTNIYKEKFWSELTKFSCPIQSWQTDSKYNYYYYYYFK